jgi:hypothetical protein
MNYHILNGDCLSLQLKEANLSGEMIICRECLIEGPIDVDHLESFWAKRAEFIQQTHGDAAANYFTKVVSEFSKIESIPQGAEVCLWFEHDLFCQANMWFVLALMSAFQIQAEVFVVYPVIQNVEDTWKGFGISDTTLLHEAYSRRIKMTVEDIELGLSLWHAYSLNDFDTLLQLAQTTTRAFNYLPEVCQAHVDRFPADHSLGRPERVIKEILAHSPNDFTSVFQVFSQKEGIYGFGDTQVKAIYDRLKATNL